ncbi:MAG: hypothetical protein J1E37_03195 [Prevotella sp.]|nr:hypothetical protein [Prevotella sp.]
MRKSFLFMRLMLGLFVSVFAFTSCSSDSDGESGAGGGGSIEGFRKLSNATITWVNYNEVMSIDGRYNSQGVLTGANIVDIDKNGTDKETISAVYGTNSFVWKHSCDEDDITYTGVLENDRIIKLEKYQVSKGYGNATNSKYYDFVYEGEKIKEISYIDWEGYPCTMKVTWNGDNVSKVERIDNRNQEVLEWAEFTYTNHLAGMLAAVAYFNPFGEFGFFDATRDAFGFYANKCGPLSKNVPQSVKTWSNTYGREGAPNTTNETRVRNYTYETDAYNYPTKVRITGDDFHEKGINMQISLTWR